MVQLKLHHFFVPIPLPFDCKQHFFDVDNSILIRYTTEKKCFIRLKTEKHGGSLMYDIAIIGSGISALFFAYTLSLAKPKLQIALLEKGAPYSKRLCPIEIGKATQCVHCPLCHRLSGFGGLGKSEGKFNYSLDFGGELPEKIGVSETLQAFQKVDKILCHLGADQIPLYNTENPFLADKLASYPNSRNLTASVRHLGISLADSICQKFEERLRRSISLYTHCNIQKITQSNGLFRLHSENGETLTAKKVIIATGQTGSAFTTSLCQDFHISPKKIRLDLGIRVEMPLTYLTNTLKGSFEAKLHYHKDELTATTYCMNPKGRVIKKHQYGLTMADGQNYRQSEPTNHLNFTVFTPFYFSTGAESLDFAKTYIGNINQNRERILCQRYTDFKNQTATSPEKLLLNSISPISGAEAGNLYEEVPKKCIDGLHGMFDTLKHLEKSDIPTDTLLYGLDGKFYEPTLPTNRFFESPITGLYIIGDASGTTSSLSQAAASGIYLGEHFIQSH